MARGGAGAYDAWLQGGRGREAGWHNNAEALRGGRAWGQGRIIMHEAWGRGGQDA
jgi:hypothetical protein